MLSFNSISLVSLVYSSALLLSQVSAHGAITGLPTREQVQFHDGKDDETGFPMDGSATLRTGGSCTKMAAMKSPVKLPSGVDLILPLMFRGGANHVGDCNIYLADPSVKGYSNADKIATIKNCAQSLNPGATSHDNNLAAAMRYNIPAKYNGQNKLLIWTLAATHISPDHPEFYDSCVDISVDPAAKDPTKYPILTQKYVQGGANVPYGYSASAPTGDYTDNRPNPPSAGTPPVATPPVATPPVATPPVATPPVATPPVSTPPDSGDGCDSCDSSDDDSSDDDSSDDDSSDDDQYYSESY